jgi:tetratricopeptide (TPR) repeat protein
MDRCKGIRSVGAVLLVTFLVSTGGCNVDGAAISRRPPRGSALVKWDKPAVDISSVEAEEVDLAEAVASHRSAYHAHLIALRDYYQSRGYVAKQRWADFELDGLRKVKAFRYIDEAEVPISMLDPKDSIAEADAQFVRARELMTKGGYGTPIFYRQKTMIQAADLFRDLIQKYPTSDKVDDAAFFLGEIHKEYLPGQDPIAVKWYERAWSWNPQTPHPARFQAAVVYDYRLHDRDRALELYRAVVDVETEHSSNARFAQRRIHELTSGRTAASAAP